MISEVLNTTSLLQILQRKKELGEPTQVGVTETAHIEGDVSHCNCV